MTLVFITIFCLYYAFVYIHICSCIFICVLKVESFQNKASLKKSGGSWTLILEKRRSHVCSTKLGEPQRLWTQTCLSVTELSTQVMSYWTSFVTCTLHHWFRYEASSQQTSNELGCVFFLIMSLETRIAVGYFASPKLLSIKL